MKKSLMMMLVAATWSLEGAAQAAADAIPAGLVTFFVTEACPPGWREAEYARGRLLLFTVAKDLVGQVQGEPTRAGTAPTHPFIDGPLGIRLKTKWFEGVNSCGNPLGVDGFYQWPVECAESDGRLPYIQLRACERRAENRSASSDPLPYGTYGFFKRSDGTCPKGWVLEDSADGRLALPLMPMGKVGGSVAQPWRTGASGSLHQHSVSYTHTFRALKICPLGIIKRSGIADAVQGPTDGLGAGRHLSLPTVRLLACRKEVFVEDGTTGEVPAGMTIFLGGRECVDGWRRWAPSVGRFVIAAPPGAILGQVLGGEPLGDRENRHHSHSCTVKFHVKAQNVCVEGGCDFCCVADSQEGEAKITTSSAPADVPYIQLSHCVWNG